MSETQTTNLGLAYPSFGTPNWNTDVQNNYAILDALTTVSGGVVILKEFPSASLNVHVAPLTYRKGDGTVGTCAGSSSFAMTTASTNFVYITDAGTLTVAAGLPTTGNYVRLATVVAGATTITSITDTRIPLVASGAHIGFGVGTPTIAAGTGAGTSPTLTITGSDQAGYITVLTGTSPTASATVATVTFGQAFNSAPRMVSIRSANSAAAVLSGNAAVWSDQGGLSSTVFTLSVGSTNLAGATTYKFWYEVLG